MSNYTKEKLISLTKYLGRLEERAASPTSKKWTKSPRTYKEFLDREIKLTKNRIEKLTLDVGTK